MKANTKDTANTREKVNTRAKENTRAKVDAVKAKLPKSKIALYNRR